MHTLTVKEGVLNIRSISRSSSCSIGGSCGNLHGGVGGSAGVAVMSGERSVALKPQCSKYIKLNVGGTLFYTTMATLTKHDNMLR